ncbi:hypothetical protein VC83_06320 [Pseudogymnoascus destructans]|uniref:Transthyretin/hydroxyisourate hydrolase domain-containing protein n=1 Tax=Pseudogymnoascus destructans TaxID=655981 RepID=A0A177AA82_9PEZI|nr:uncharacterized protein VC83_06320 [Pseudogymnoascus destructans]OAF59007.1 hypothetical protein VC83_06320 [Pseudogymnoascus destructans]
MATSKAPISCHVLDTVIGRPGASIKVTLSCLSAPNKQFGSIPHTFTGVTNSDGRIAEWENKFGVEVWSVVNEGSDEDDKNGTTVWSLKFDTEGYYGEGKTFWPYVELTFRVQKGEHYHRLWRFSYMGLNGEERCKEIPVLEPTVEALVEEEPLPGNFLSHLAMGHESRDADWRQLSRLRPEDLKGKIPN